MGVGVGEGGRGVEIKFRQIKVSKYEALSILSVLQTAKTNLNIMTHTHIYQN